MNTIGVTAAFLEPVKTAYDQYSGTGKLLPLFFLCLLVLWIAEKDREKRNIILYPSLLLLLFALEPFVKGLISSLGERGVFLRAFYMLPVCLVCAYAFVCVFRCAKGFKAAAGTFLMILLLITMSGSPAWADGRMKPAENLLKIPAEDVEIFDYLLSRGENPRAFMPGELLLISNQYTSRIDTFYQIPPDGDIQDFTEDQVKVYAQMEAQHMDSQMLARIAKREDYDYIILKKDYHFPRTPLELLSFREAASTLNYIIYEREEQTD